MKKTVVIFSFTIAMLLLGLNSNGVFAQESFKIYKGWNLVPFYSLDEIESVLGEVSLEGTVFYLDPVTKNYKLFYNHGMNEEFTNIGNEYYLEDSSYVISNPLWFFSDSEFNISRDYSDFADSEIRDGGYELKLFNGWNIIRFNRFFVGKSFDNITVNCQLERMHEFDSGSQTWSQNILEKFREGIFREVDDDKYDKSYAVRVGNDCNFDFTE